MAGFLINAIPRTKSSGVNEVSSYELNCCSLILETPPPEVVDTIAKYFEASLEQNKQTSDLHIESGSDSGDSLFLTQKDTVPKAVRSQKRRPSGSTLEPAEPEEPEDDVSERGSISSSAAASSTHSKRRKLPNRTPRKYYFPFIERNCGVNGASLGLHQNAILENSAIGGFFKCVKALNKSPDIPQSYIDDKKALYPLSETEERWANDGMAIVKRNRFARPSKQMRFQTWHTSLTAKDKDSTNALSLRTPQKTQERTRPTLADGTPGQTEDRLGPSAPLSSDAVQSREEKRSDLLSPDDPESVELFQDESAVHLIMMDVVEKDYSHNLSSASELMDCATVVKEPSRSASPLDTELGLSAETDAIAQRTFEPQSKDSTPEDDVNSEQLNVRTQLVPVVPESPVSNDGRKKRKKKRKTVIEVVQEDQDVLQLSCDAAQRPPNDEGETRAKKKKEKRCKITQELEKEESLSLNLELPSVEFTGQVEESAGSTQRPGLGLCLGSTEMDQNASESTMAKDNGHFMEPHKHKKKQVLSSTGHMTLKDNSGKERNCEKRKKSKRGNVGVELPSDQEGSESQDAVGSVDIEVTKVEGTPGQTGDRLEPSAPLSSDAVEPSEEKRSDLLSPDDPESVEVFKDDVTSPIKDYQRKEKKKRKRKDESAGHLIMMDVVEKDYSHNLSSASELMDCATVVKESSRSASPLDTELGLFAETDAIAQRTLEPQSKDCESPVSNDGRKKRKKKRKTVIEVVQEDQDVLQSSCDAAQIPPNDEGETRAKKKKEKRCKITQEHEKEESLSLNLELPSVEFTGRVEESAGSTQRPGLGLCLGSTEMDQNASESTMAKDTGHFMEPHKHKKKQVLSSTGHMTLKDNSEKERNCEKRKKSKRGNVGVELPSDQEGSESQDAVGSVDIEVTKVKGTPGQTGDRLEPSAPLASDAVEPREEKRSDLLSPDDPESVEVFKDDITSQIKDYQPKEKKKKKKRKRKDESAGHLIMMDVVEKYYSHNLSSASELMDCATVLKESSRSASPLDTELGLSAETDAIAQRTLESQSKDSTPEDDVNSEQLNVRTQLVSVVPESPVSNDGRKKRKKKRKTVIEVVQEDQDVLQLSCDAAQIPPNDEGETRVKKKKKEKRCKITQEHEKEESSSLNLELQSVEFTGQVEELAGSTQSPGLGLGQRKEKKKKKKKRKRKDESAGHLVMKDVVEKDYSHHLSSASELMDCATVVKQSSRSASHLDTELDAIAQRTLESQSKDSTPEDDVDSEQLNVRTQLVSVVPESPVSNDGRKRRKKKRKTVIEVVQEDQDVLQLSCDAAQIPPNDEGETRVKKKKKEKRCKITQEHEKEESSSLNLELQSVEFTGQVEELAGSTQSPGLGLGQRKEKKKKKRKRKDESAGHLVMKDVVEKDYSHHLSSASELMDCATVVKQSSRSAQRPPNDKGEMRAKKKKEKRCKITQELEIEESLSLNLELQSATLAKDTGHFMKPRKERKRKQVPSSNEENVETASEGHMTLEDKGKEKKKKKREKIFVEEETDIPKVPQHPEISLSDATTMTHESPTAQHEEQTSRKKKQKKRIKTPATQLSEDTAAQSDYPVSVQKKEKRVSGAFLVAGAAEKDAKTHQETSVPIPTQRVPEWSGRKRKRMDDTDTPASEMEPVGDVEACAPAADDDMSLEKKRRKEERKKKKRSPTLERKKQESMLRWGHQVPPFYRSNHVRPFVPKSILKKRRLYDPGQDHLNTDWQGHHGDNE